MNKFRATGDFWRTRHIDRNEADVTWTVENNIGWRSLAFSKSRRARKVGCPRKMDGMENDLNWDEWQKLERKSRRWKKIIVKEIKAIQGL